MRKLLFLLPFALMLLGSCLKSSTDDTTAAIVAPLGTFSGQFRKVHFNGNNGKYDTVKCNIVLTMSKDSGYRVLSDTTTIHAGSKGSFQVTTGYLNFVDSTYPKTGTPKKFHLAGTYGYVYDGSNVFQAYAIYADTLSFQYDLRKIK